MAGKGGARPGAGRKRKVDKHETAISRAEKQISDRLPSLIENMFALADGVTVQETDSEGGVRVYTRPPDRQANEYLINRVMGKPTERQEVSGPEGEDIRVTLSIRERAGRELEEWRKAQTDRLSSLPSVLPTAPTSPTPMG